MLAKSTSNIVALKELKKTIKEYSLNIVPNELISALIIECALQIINPSTSNALKKYLTNNIYNQSKYSKIIDSLIDRSELLNTYQTYYKCFNTLWNIDNNFLNSYSYDILGWLYSMLRSDKKNTGSYYTNINLVHNLLDNAFKDIDNAKELKYCDPSCGSGIFVIELMKIINCTINNVYAIDIDPIAVFITRINILCIILQRYNYNINELPSNIQNIIVEHIMCNNFLKDDTTYDVFIGNPPWGYKFNKEEMDYVYAKYDTAKIDSYDIFIEHSLDDLNLNGYMMYIVPESLLNVNVHIITRNKLLNNNTIKHLTHLGNQFDNVLCPCIELFVQRRKATKDDLIDITYIDKLPYEEKPSSYSHTISNIAIDYNDNRMTRDSFQINISDKTYNICNHIAYNRKDDIVYLNNMNTDWMLGIVTGDNKKWLKDMQINNNYERIIIGKEIEKYYYNDVISKYVDVSNLSKFNQIAPLELYRAKEKIIYKFICRELICAYDNRRKLMLNSCNAFIPHIANTSVLYILALLNSSVLQYYYHYNFDTIKVLKSNIKKLPLVVDSMYKETIERCMNVLVNENISDKIRNDYRDRLDDIIFQLYDLSQDDIHEIKRFCGKY